jgi:hypothetical protein
MAMHGGAEGAQRQSDLMVRSIGRLQGIPMRFCLYFAVMLRIRWQKNLVAVWRRRATVSETEFIVRPPEGTAT